MVAKEKVAFSFQLLSVIDLERTKTTSSGNFSQSESSKGFIYCSLYQSSK